MSFIKLVMSYAFPVQCQRLFKKTKVGAAYFNLGTLKFMS